MATGHVLDANTIALLRMDDAARVELTTAGLLDAGPNARHMSDTTVYSNVCPGPRAYQGPASGRTQGCLARRVKTSSAAFTCPNVGGDATALNGNWTVKAWVYLDGANTAALLRYQAGGESTATNWLMGFDIGVTGTISSFWETGGGTDVSASSPASVVPIGAWAHVAIIKDDDPVNSGKKRLTYVVNGSSVGTSSNLTNSTGGTSCSWQIASGPFTFRSMMVKSVVDSVGTIATDAARTTGSDAYTHTETSNVIIHYKCDELPDLWDEAGNYHMRLLTGVPPGVGDTGLYASVEPLINDGGRSLFFDGTTKFQSSTFRNEIMRQAALNSWTLECWFRAGTSNPLSASKGLLVFGNPGGESSVDNYIAIDITTAGTVQYDIEHGAGVNSSTTSPSAILTNANKYDTHHFAFVKYQSAGSAVFDVYLDGAKIGSTSSALVEFDGGTNNVLQIGVGDLNTSGFWQGWLDDIRISNVARSGAEILASYTAGITTPPTVTTVYIPINEDW